MFLYWFVPRPWSDPGILGLTMFFLTVRTSPRPATDFCPHDNFLTTFWISLIFGTIVGPDLQITWLDFGRFSSWPWTWIFKVKYGICYISAKNRPIATKQKAEFSRSNMEFAISQPKIVRLPQNKKQTYQLNSRPQMWPSALTLAMTLTLTFQGQICICYISAKNRPIATKQKAEFSRSNMEFAISQPKIVRLPQNKKQTYQLNSRPQMWPSALTLAMTLTLTFQGQICNLLHLSPKWSACHETKSKHIDWTLGLKWPHQIKFDLGHEFDLEFSRSNMEFAFISTKKGQITTKQKANISNELQASNVTNGFDLGNDLDLWIFKVKYDLDHTHGDDQGFSWSTFEIAVSQNGRADWHWTKGVGVGHSWPWPQPFGDQAQVKGSTTKWPGWLQMSACRRLV